MGASTTARPGYFARISALFRWCWGSVLVRFWDTGNALVTRRFVTRRFTARIPVEIGLRALSGRRCSAGVGLERSERAVRLPGVSCRKWYVFLVGVVIPAGRHGWAGTVGPARLGRHGWDGTIGTARLGQGGWDEADERNVGHAIV